MQYKHLVDDTFEKILESFSNIEGESLIDAIETIIADHFWKIHDDLPNESMVKRNTESLRYLHELSKAFEYSIIQSGIGMNPLTTSDLLESDGETIKKEVILAQHLIRERIEELKIELKDLLDDAEDRGMIF